MKLLWLAAYWGALVWSATRPQDYFTWFLEALPALMVFVVLAVTYKRFPLTPLAYILILMHCLILFLGAHYTYAEVDALLSRLFGYKTLRQAWPLAQASFRDRCPNC
jgi:putative membrane protein